MKINSFHPKDDMERQLREAIEKSLDELHHDNQTISETSNQVKKSTTDYMTLEQYVNNPTGKGSAFVAARSAIKFGLNNTYIKLLREYRKQFYAVPYIYKNGDILFYVKVPSEDYKNNKIAYDVLFLLEYDKDKKRRLRKMRLYSNSPSFIFTYCYVYNKEGLIIDKLRDKLPYEALTKAPVIRNPI